MPVSDINCWRAPARSARFRGNIRGGGQTTEGGFFFFQLEAKISPFPFLCLIYLLLSSASTICLLWCFWATATVPNILKSYSRFFLFLHHKDRWRN